MGSQPHRTDTHTHKFQIDKHNIGTCKCGEVRQFPWNAKDPTIVLKRGNPGISQVKTSQVKEEHMAISNREKHRHYEEHKVEILADLRSTGRVATRKKWEIPSSTLAQLEKRWLTPQERQALTLRSYASRRSPAGSQAVVTPTKNNLSSFPEFSNEWAESVQIKWFEVYEKLIGIPLIGNPYENAGGAHEEHLIWFKLLALASNSRNPGVIQSNDKLRLAVAFGVPLKLLEQSLAKFIEQGMIIDNEHGLTIVNWKKYAQKIDSV